MQPADWPGQPPTDACSHRIKPLSQLVTLLYLFRQLGLQLQNLRLALSKFLARVSVAFHVSELPFNRFQLRRTKAVEFRQSRTNLVKERLCGSLVLIQAVQSSLPGARRQIVKWHRSDRPQSGNVDIAASEYSTRRQKRFPVRSARQSPARRLSTEQ